MSFEIVAKRFLYAFGCFFVALTLLDETVKDYDVLHVCIIYALSAWWVFRGYCVMKDGCE